MLNSANIDNIKASKNLFSKAVWKWSRRFHGILRSQGFLSMPCTRRWGGDGAPCVKDPSGSADLWPRALLRHRGILHGKRSKRLKKGKHIWKSDENPMTSHGRVKTPPQDGLLDNIWQPLPMPLLSFSPLCSGPLAILPVELLESCSTGAATSSTMAKIAQFGETDYLTTPLWVLKILGDLCRMSGVCTMNILWSVSCLRLYLRLKRCNELYWITVCQHFASCCSASMQKWARSNCGLNAVHLPKF